MYAVFQRNNGTLVRVNGFDQEVNADSRTFYYIGTIDGLVQSDYTVERNITVPNLVRDLDNRLPAIFGRYAGVSIRDGVLEFAVSDIGAIEELYYTTTETELIVSTDFFEVAKAKGQLNYDVSEALFFVRQGFCRSGSTTFDGVHRLPPGAALHLSEAGSPYAQRYLSRFTGAPVTYEVFKNALSHVVRSIIQNNPAFEEVIMFSGGVDSSVLLSLVKNVKDVTAVTYRFFPTLWWNWLQVQHAETMAKKLQVSQEVVDVDLNEIHIGYLDDVIVSMPFAAHLGINFKSMFEALQSRKKRLWCGQDLDTLYNYNATLDHQVINRFLYSDAYGRMLNGISGARRYRPVKKLLDAALKSIYRYYTKQRFETPDTLDELIEYLNESDRWLAFRLAGVKNRERIESSEPSKGVSVSEIRSASFDKMLEGFMTGRDHKIQLQATKLFDTEMILAYSTPSIIHMLRDLRFTVFDVLMAKRFMYRYARALGLSKRDFRSKRSLQTPENASQDWERIFESTNFGTELHQKTNNLATQIGFVLDTKDKYRWQIELGILWINNVHEKLSKVGVEVPGWPIVGRG